MSIVPSEARAETSRESEPAEPGELAEEIARAGQSQGSLLIVLDYEATLGPPNGSALDLPLLVRGALIALATAPDADVVIVSAGEASLRDPDQGPGCRLCGREPERGEDRGSAQGRGSRAPGRRLPGRRRELREARRGSLWRACRAAARRARGISLGLRSGVGRGAPGPARLRLERAGADPVSAHVARRCRRRTANAYATFDDDVVFVDRFDPRGAAGRRLHGTVPHRHAEAQRKSGGARGAHECRGHHRYRRAADEVPLLGELAELPGDLGQRVYHRGDRHGGRYRAGPAGA